jgi:hypothetical protein
MLFSVQTRLTFSEFLEFLNHYDYSKIKVLLGPHPKKLSQDETIIYQMF